MAVEMIKYSFLIKTPDCDIWYDAMTNVDITDVTIQQQMAYKDAMTFANEYYGPDFIITHFVDHINTGYRKPISELMGGN